MKVISIRRGNECDHSTRDYGYISGMKVFYDYGVFRMTFTIPYNTELFKILKKYEGIDGEKRFNKIEITLDLYCDDFNEDENDYVELAGEIRDEIINKNIEIINILSDYHNQEDSFLDIKTKTQLGKKLQKVLTASW